jgi:hypothetical protein
VDRPRRPLHATDDHIYSEDTGKEYLKFIGVIFGLLLLSLVLTFGRGWGIKYVWEDFIAVFLIISAAYKMFRLEVFSTIYRTYDVIAVRYRVWAYLFPFVELALGGSYLLSNGSFVLYVITLLVTSVSIFSFLKRPSHRSHVQYACLDHTIQLPLATISFVEGVIIFVLAAIMLIFY